MKYSELQQMSVEELEHQRKLQNQAQQGCNQWPREALAVNRLAATTVVVCLSDEDVQRIAEAVVARAAGRRVS